MNQKFLATSAFERRLIRSLGLRRDPRQVATLARVPVDRRRMLRHTVVPGHDCSRLPGHAHVEVSSEGDVVVKEAK